MKINKKLFVLSALLVGIESFLIISTKLRKNNEVTFHKLIEGQEVKIIGVVIKNKPWEEFDIQTDQGKEIVGWDTLNKYGRDNRAVKCRGNVNVDSLKVRLGDYIEVFGKVINGRVNTCSDSTDKYYVTIINPAHKKIDPNTLQFCRANDLLTEFYGEPVMAGGFSASIRFTNNSINPCILEGSPEVEVLNGNNKKVPLDIGKTPCAEAVEGNEYCQSTKKVVLIPLADQAEEAGFPQGNATIDLWWTTSEISKTGDLEDCPILGVKEIKFKVKLPGNGDKLLVTEPKELQPFINRICNGISVGKFDGI